MSFQHFFGANPSPSGTQFRVWAPDARGVAVVIEAPQRATQPLQGAADGIFAGFVPAVGAGARYRYLIEGRGAFPDPASRFQPDGVHGPSEVVDPRAFAWTDAGWRGVGLEELVIYELHVGTFTPGGTYASASERLPELARLGVTAVELMPLADFPGQRNWGYDGVALFAPARCYGRPDELRAFVDSAHRAGLAVLLDVVYNHMGPDGNNLGNFSRQFFSKTPTPWGIGFNFDGPGSPQVRRFFVENLLHWLTEYHLDGLRLDATQAIADTSAKHILAELADEARAAITDRQVVLIAEDSRNLARLLKPRADHGWGIDGVWTDDFYFQFRRLLTGDHEGYFRDYRGSIQDLATTVRQGWFYTGQFSTYYNRPRGSDPTGIPVQRFVYYIQNHDQVGNRPLGDRLQHGIDLASYRAATALLLLSPGTPLLFMGQEWAARTPFYFFTDHKPQLGKRIRDGRAREFRHVQPHADLSKVPDPQDVATFRRCQLDWSEREREPHASVLRLYERLLHLRRTKPALRSPEFDVQALDETALVLRRSAADGSTLLAVVQLRQAGVVDLHGSPLLQDERWQIVLTSEEAAFAVDPQPPEVELGGAGPVVRFQRPGAVVLRAIPNAPSGRG